MRILSYVPQEEIIKYLKKKSFEDIVKACNDIYDYKYITGELKENSILRVFASEMGTTNVRDIEAAVIEYASRKLSKSVLLLFETQPYRFLKHYK